ncbi:MAG: TPM domain-containing protein [Desulfocapsaceae bacterium]
MKTLAQNFLTDDEQRTVTEAVQTAEKQTSGEIVPMIVSESHSYPVAPIIGGVFLALPTALLSARLCGGLLWLGTDNMWLFLIFFSIYYAIAYLAVKQFPSLKRLFLSPERADLAVREAAASAFFSEALHDTRDANGILLYVSVFERRVWVLGDHGIDERIDPQIWKEIVDLVSHGIRQGGSCRAICEGIERIGTILHEHFPIEADDKDELHNLIIR